MRVPPPFRLPPFQYKPLTSPTSIRLLRLQPTIKNRIRYSLQEFDLNDVPPFSALSYTWGSPMTPYSLASQALQRSSGKRSLATSATKPGSKNWLIGKTVIHDVEHEPGDPKRPESIICDGCALPVTLNLRNALRMLASIDFRATGFTKDGYVWIDAISINQSDIEERNLQVSLMSDIFKQAQSVIAWLGPADEFSTDAQKVIESIGNLPEDAGESMEDYTSFFEGQNASVYKRLEITPLSYHNWMGFIAFVSRPWFERAWIVQEVSLAKTVILVSGSSVFNFGLVSRILKFVYNTRWYHHLQAKKLRHLKELRKDQGIYRSFLRSDASITMARVYLDKTRDKMVATRTARGYLPVRRGPTLRMLMETHRFTKTVDPRDKVYAFLGLADPRSAPFKSLAPHEMIKPDYNLSVSQLYLNVTRAFMLSSKNLFALSNVQDPSLTKIQGLPSWVPDYSVPIQPYPLNFRGWPPFKAAVGRDAPRWQPDVPSIAQGLLHVQGHCVDTIKQVAPLQNECKNPAIFWNEIIKISSSLSDRYAVSYTNGYRPSRVEVLWRVLVTNTYKRISPAPPECGEKFIDYILNLQFRHSLISLNLLSTDMEFQPHQTHSNNTILPDWHALLAAEPKDSAFGFDLYEKRFLDVVSKIFKNEYNPIGLSQLQHELEFASGSVRRVFQTENDLLGTGAVSLQPGDEVWVLFGAPVPFVLRRMENGRHRLIGETYVHGIMAGKALTMGLKREDAVIA